MFLPAVFGAMETLGALITDEVTRLMLSARRLIPPGEPVLMVAGAADTELTKIPYEVLLPPAVPVTVTLPVPLMISCTPD